MPGESAPSRKPAVRVVHTISKVRANG